MVQVMLPVMLTEVETSQIFPIRNSRRFLDFARNDKDTVPVVIA